MTRLRGCWPAAAVSLFLLTACAGQTPTAVDAPAGAASASATATGAALVIRVREVGGFVSAATNVTRLPLVSVYADGRVITQGPQIEIFPAPALPSVQVQQIDPAMVGTLVDMATAAGVRTGADLGQPGVADLPTTRFSVMTGAGSQTVDVLALTGGGDDLPGLTAAHRAARAKLAGYLQVLRELPDSAGPAPSAAASPPEQYEPQALAAVAQPYVAPADSPVSAAPPVPWTGPALPGESFGAGLGLSCVAVSGDAVRQLMQAARSANVATPWASGGKQWTVTFRPLLPDESGCADLRSA